MKNYNQQTCYIQLKLLYTVQGVRGIQDTLHFKNDIYIYIYIYIYLYIYIYGNPWKNQFYCSFPDRLKFSKQICFFPGIGVCSYTKINN